MRPLHRIAVYCASSNDVPERYFQAARDFGILLAGQGIGIVYGGGRVGLMGALADAPQNPRKLMDLEVGHTGVTRLEVVETMAIRKGRMAELADAFVALPGGIGTLEEISEATSLAQLNYQDKPVGLYNCHGFWDALVSWLDHAAQEGFIRPIHRDLVAIDSDASQLIERLRAAVIPRVEDWAPRPPEVPQKA